MLEQGTVFIENTYGACKHIGPSLCDCPSWGTPRELHNCPQLFLSSCQYTVYLLVPVIEQIDPNQKWLASPVFNSN